MDISVFKGWIIKFFYVFVKLNWFREVTGCDVKPNIKSTDITCAVGSTVMLMCNTPPGTIGWYGPPNQTLYAYKADINWPSISNDLRLRLKIIHEYGIYNLQISNLQPTDAGHYMCKLRQAFTDFNLAVIGNLTVSVNQLTYNGNIGDKISLGCTVSSTTSPVKHVTWYKTDGSMVAKIRRTEDKYSGSTPSNPSLTVSNLMLSDVGPYFCSATNELGLRARSNTTNLSLVDRRRNRPRGIIITVIASLLVLVVVLSLIVFVKKKKPTILRQIAYQFQKYKDDDSKTWDAFVSFKSETADTDFVVKQLYPKLEKEMGFKLCIHHKDFLPGKAITNNIVDAILNSRRTILILSKEYLHGSYTTFEYEVAQSEMVKSKHLIIPILLDDIENLEGSMDDTMKYIIQSVTYIRWPGEINQKANKTFWQRLELAMPKKSKRARTQDREHSLSLLLE